MNDQAEIDELVRQFFALFTNANGQVPDVSRIHDVCIPAAVITKAVGAKPEIYSLGEFVTPRQAMLTNGTLTEFEEFEESHRTDIFGNIAQRLSGYRKHGMLSGQRFETSGQKVFQFIRTPSGWRISAVAWDDA